MAEQARLTDEELRVLAREGTKEDLEGLNEAELRRLGRIITRNDQGVTAPPYKHGEGPLPELPKDTDIPMPKATAFPGIGSA